jgi:nitroreductase
MNTLDAIAARRSIRRFRDEPVSDEDLRTILAAAVQAPSGKNAQPWRFVVVQGEHRAEMVRLMRQGIARQEGLGRGVGSAVGSARIMEQAPVTVFVLNASGLHPWLAHSVGESFGNLVDVQSVGAAIQNMLLAAQDLGLGSLWICDVFFAY